MRNFVISGMALIAATYGLARFGYGLFLPRFTETFEMGPVVSGSIQAGSFLIFCLAAVVAARIGARPRLIITCGGATAAIGAAGVAASPHVLVFTVSVIVAGAGIVVTGLLMFLTLGQWRLGWWIIAALVAAVTVATLRTDRSSRLDLPEAPEVVSHRPMVNTGCLSALAVGQAIGSGPGAALDRGSRQAASRVDR